MAEKKYENQTPENGRQDNGLRLVIPFFAVLAVMTVVSFILPLRPTVSYLEKRELAKFPEFSLSALMDGSYFDDITLWYSDTFPGREGWMGISDYMVSLHGYSEIGIVGDLTVSDQTPEDQQPLPGEAATEPEEDIPATKPADDEPSATEGEAVQETQPTEPQGWGGINAGEGAEIAHGAVIQIDDFAFNYLAFSEVASQRYADIISEVGDLLAPSGVRVVSAPSPTAVGVMVEPEYLEMLKCGRQDEMIHFMHGAMSDSVITVDTYTALVEHNDEYIYFRTDHHWTALGAYYSYEAVCEALGYEPAPLDAFEAKDNGPFLGSLYPDARWPGKLKEDNVISYIPEGDITMLVFNNYDIGVEFPLFQDMTGRTKYETYLTFIYGDNAMIEITNESIPDGPTCLVVKDSFGNCFIPFLTQNYHKVYAIDYRHYQRMGIPAFVEKYGVDDVLFIPYMIATQGMDGTGCLDFVCRS